MNEKAPKEHRPFYAEIANELVERFGDLNSERFDPFANACVMKLRAGKPEGVDLAMALTAMLITSIERSQEMSRACSDLAGMALGLPRKADLSVAVDPLPEPFVMKVNPDLKRTPHQAQLDELRLAEARALREAAMNSFRSFCAAQDKTTDDVDSLPESLVRNEKPDEPSIYDDPLNED